MDTRDIIDCLDFTLLDHDSSEDELVSFCSQANSVNPAAVCVFSEHQEIVHKHLDEGIALAVVAGGFPVGSSSPEEIEIAVRAAVESGADEVDVVLEPRDSEDFPDENELEKLIAMREAAGEAVLKVIIEAPLLAEREMRSATRMALAAGADFIKTCTGKRGSCSDEAADIFAYEIMRHELTFKEKRGLKLSGGIRTKEDVKRLTELVNARDDSIIASSRFRIGASSLLNELI